MRPSEKQETGLLALKQFQTACLIEYPYKYGRLNILISDGLKRLQNLHLWRISSLCTARKLACLHDMSALFVRL
ncbi:hypothetical protein EGK75_01290 [Neisseria weixii]|uniref:Uncharacterized protein n=1 Tax=Neisseria weixii TaxID=1853276 RepID=A0A3N4NEC1_9NEIS|nr:hypothetical protein CGZ65_06100 [Neisseria weixii]RPD90480.1 hypothetical protein EGK74_01655 [Neisseria weixii]RPD90578.1 hypothetical protein EGK75_01290 [Neisseria weixii]